MKFILEKASDKNFEEEIEVNTLEELKKLSEGYEDHRLVIDFEGWAKRGNTPAIKIYDDYIE